MAITAEQQTNIITLVVGTIGAAPGNQILADLAEAVDAGTTIAELAEMIASHPLVAGDTGIYPAFLPNAVFADQYMQALLGAEVTAENMALAVEAATGLLNGGSTRAELMVAAIGYLSALDVADPAFGAAAAALANKVAVAEYYSVTVAQDGDLDAMIAALDGVDSTAASVTAANAAIDAAIPAVPFDLNAGFAAIETAEDAIAAFLTAEETTEAAINAAVGLAVTDYDDAINAIAGAPTSAFATDSVAARAAILSGALGIAGASLTDLQTAAAGAATAVAGVSGLTEAVASETATAAALAAADLADDETATTLLAEEAAYDVTGVASATVDTVDQAGGVITANTNGGSEFGAGAVVLTTVTSGVTALAAETATWTTAQKAEFAEMQATAGVAEVIAAWNADQSAQAATSAANDAWEDAELARDLLDADPAGAVTLGLLGAGFTLTTPASAATPTLTEILAEEAALAAAATAAQTVEDGAIVADDAADAALLVADNAVTAAGDPGTYGDAEAAADVVTTDGLGGVPVQTGTLVRAGDGSIQGNLGAGLVDIVVVQAGSLVFAAGIVADVGGLLAALLAASAGLEAAEAAQVLADAAVNTAVTGTAAVLLAASDVSDDADLAVGVFDTLITDAVNADITNPLSTALTDADDAVDVSQGLVDDIAAAVTELADAQTNETALAALTAMLTAANDAFGDNGFSVPEDVDTAAEFATALDDIFAAGDLDASIYNFNLQGDDILYVGTDHTVSDADIGAGVGQTLLEDAGDINTLEIFLESTNGGLDTTIHIEEETFGAQSDETTDIVLVGIAIDDVQIVDGFVSIV